MKVMLTILTSVAQEESLHKSQSIRWGIQRSFEKEDSKYTNRICYGYCHNQNGKLIIDIIQAEIIRTIFCLHLDGYSLRRISKELSDQKILSPRGSQRWGPETLNKILKNEKYIGNVLLQKTVVENYLIGNQLINQGQENQYLISDSHPAIIARELFKKIKGNRVF